MHRMHTRLNRLETKSKGANSVLDDEEIVERFKNGTFTRLHIDALFQIIEPAALGYLIMSAYELRPTIGALLGEWQRPCFPMEAAGWVVAAGNGVTTLVDDDLAWWEEQFNELIEENPASNDQHWHVWDVHQELVKRLLQKHGLEHLRSLVKAMCDASVDHREKLIDQFVPSADEDRRQRMSRVSAPLRPFVGWSFNPFPLIVLAPDANLFWYILDNTGQKWTPMHRSPKRL